MGMAGLPPGDDGSVNYLALSGDVDTPAARRVATGLAIVRIDPLAAS